MVNENNNGKLERVTLHAREAASYIGVSYWTILELAKEQKIPHVRVGNRVLFRAFKLDEWMDEQENNSVSQVDAGTLRRLY